MRPCSLKQGDKVYFDTLTAYLEKGRDEFFHFLRNIDNKAFQVGKVPECIKLELFIAKMQEWKPTDVHAWLYEVLTEDKFEFSVNEANKLKPYENGISPFQTSDLYKLYKLQRGESLLTPAVFGSNL